MSRVTIGELALLECAACDGVWIDAAEFERICSGREAQAAVLHRWNNRPAVPSHAKVEVLDVDLAGSTRPSRRGGFDLRVVRGKGDWPRISLRYTLEEDGKPVRSGEEAVEDMDYTHGLVGYRKSVPLYYEKRMLDKWFRARFAEGRAAAY